MGQIQISIKTAISVQDQINVKIPLVNFFLFLYLKLTIKQLFLCLEWPTNSPCP